jgi:hypothetical protein
MKKLVMVAIVFAAFAVLFAGCGKSDEMKKLEAGLNTEIMQKHDDLMKEVAKLDKLADQMTALSAKQDSLTKLFPKQFAGQETTDLLAAKEKLQAAKNAMMAWMKEFKPFDPELKHEMIMESLTKTKTELTAMEHQFQEATTVASDALAKHSALMDQLAAKLPKKK